METNNQPNRLINEKSPYLIQHAYNPVSWLPWGSEAFDKAVQEDKPILLSIGYSTCHWCHVMAEESFEDKEIADILNRSFISVKVDKEERPDLDAVYMMACQLLSGQGGWPTTLFLTPTGEPFFAGTYFPKNSINGRMGFIDILNRITRSWAESRQEINNTGKEIIDRVNKERNSKSQEWRDGALSDEILFDGIRQFVKSFDEINGGFGRSPKFPAPHNILFLLEFSEKYKNDEALRMAEKTLIQMYRGGIYDHIGGGFSRYSTDSRWLAPHFEKMLYDNAMLAMAYTKAYAITEDNLYKEVAESVLDYVLREMTAPEAGFYSAQDADSQGEEGKYYIFSKEEILKVLGEKAGEEFCEAYDITERGNFEGSNILNLLYNYNYAEADKDYRLQKKILLDYRLERMELHKDDKILVAWNGMMIAAFAYGSLALGQRKYLDAAVKAEGFISEKLTKRNGKLMVRYRNNQSIGTGHLDDYAYYIWGLLELYAATKKVGYLQKAIDYNDVIISDFSDAEGGGYYFTSIESEKLIWRPKETYDGAIPSGNSVTAWNMVKLAEKMGSSGLKEKAEHQLRFLADEAGDYPLGHSFTLYALTYYLHCQ